MDRRTRDSFASGTQGDITSGNACWETAPAVFVRLAEDFGPFDIDLTADAQRKLVPLWFGPGSPVSVDALMVSWALHGMRGYSNPPYGPFVQRILEKAKGEGALGFRSTLLLPLRVTKAFRAHVLNGASDLIFPDSRLTFFENGLPRCGYDKRGRVRADPAMFDSILVQYGPESLERPRLSEWHVPPHVFQGDLDKWVALHPYPEWLEQQQAA